MGGGQNAGGLAKRRTGWVMPMAVFFVTACASALVLAYYVLPDSGELGVELPAPSAGTREVALAIGGTRFRIPANFLPLASTRRGGSVGSIAMAALLPNLAGYSIDDAPAFADNGATSRVVAIGLHGAPVPPSEDERLARIYLPQVQDTGGTPGPYGLMRYAFRADSGYHAQELFVGETPAGKAIFLCTRLDAGAPAPNCMRDTALAPDLALSYRFKRESLKDWRAIEDGVRALTARFRQQP